MWIKLNSPYYTQFIIYHGIYFHMDYPLDIPLYHNFPAYVYYHFFNTVHNFIEWNIFTAGRKELTEHSVLLFIGGLIFCGLNKSFFYLICNILYRTKLFLTNLSLHILFVVLHCIDPSRRLALRKISNLPCVLLNLLLIC